ncbi:MAG: PAS domain S-box protein [Chloroflexi bacterium]|nr:PAS domain S-box protein [Chloroflexota bacterium]
MKLTALPAPDPRIESIFEQIMQLAAGRLQARGAPSNQNDELDGIIAGLNMLGEELSATTLALTEMNANLETRVQERTRELEKANHFIAALSQATARIAATSDPDQAMVALGDELKRLDVFCAIALAEPDADTLIVRYTSIQPERVEAAEKLLGFKIYGYRVPRENWPAEETPAHRRPLFMPDTVSFVAAALSHLPRPALEQSIRLFNVAPQSPSIYLPMIVNEEVIGLLAVWGAYLTEDSVPAFSVFAGQAATAIENARLYAAERRRAAELANISDQLRTELAERKRVEETLQKRLDQLGAVHTMTTLVSQAESEEEIYQEALCALQRVLNVDRASILLFDSEGVARFRAWAGLSDAYRQAVDGHSPWKVDEQNARPILVPDVEADASLGRLRNVILAEGVRALGFFPLAHQGQLLGKFMLYYNNPRQFTEADLQLAETIAGQIAFTIARKRAEETLRNHEERYRGLFEDSPVALWEEDFSAVNQYLDVFRAQSGVDLKAYLSEHPAEVAQAMSCIRVVDVNRTAVKLYQADTKETLLAQAGRVFVAETQSIFVEELMALAEGRTEFAGEGVNLDLAGNRIDINLRWSVMPGHEQNLSKVLVSIEDITGRKKAEAALKDSEIRYRQLFEQAGDAIYLENLQGDIIDVNQRACDMHGYSREELLALKVPDLQAPEARRPLATVVPEQVARSRAGQPFEGLDAHRDGRRIPVEIAAAPLGESGLVLTIVRDITQRKRAEEALREAELKYRTLVEQMPAIIYIVEFGEVNRTTYISPQVEKILGFTPEEWLTDQKLWLKQIHPDDRDHVLANVRQNDAEQRSLDLEYRVFTRDGRAVWIRNRASLALGEAGKPKSSIGVMQDITGRKKVEEALRESEASYRGLFDSVAEAVYIQDWNGRFLDVNQGAVEMYGYPREFFIGKTPEFLSAPGKNDPERIIELFKRAFAGEPQLFEFWGRRRNGEAFPKEVRLYKGSYFGQEVLIALAQDITERKQAEVQLRQLSRAVEQSPVSIVITDKEGNIEYVNSRFTEVTGYTSEEAIGQNPRILKADHAPEADYKQLWDTITAGGEWRGEFCNKKKGGELFWELASVSPIKNEQGRITHYLAVKENITERKKTEAALAIVNADLERALLNANELAVAAQSANRAKSEFLANMSHEIRTPLTAVLGLTELALASELTAEQRAWLGQVYTSGRALLELINNILDLSKIEADRLELDKVEFELPALIQQATTTLAARAAAKQLDFNYSLGVDTPRVLVGDPVRLRQVLLNLLDNAIKFTERGEVSLRTRVEARTADEVTLRFTVRDTGIGIPEDKQAIIFEPFTQADGHIARQFGGTGLGLTISQRLVEEFGGLLWVESRAGEGSTFHFTALFALPAWPGQPEAVEKAPVEEAGPIKEYPLNILLVEDNPANQIVLSSILKKRGWQVTLVGTGREALERAAEETFHLILMDLQMPDMDGLAATAAIRAHEQVVGGHVPILALTAFAMSGDRERCLQAGMDDYLAKPVKASELYHVVERLTG